MRFRRSIFRLLPLVATLVLAGCWTPPVATVQPKGPPRVIQGGFPVESAMRPVVVQSVDLAARTLVLRAGASSQAQEYPAGRKVSGIDRITSGERVHARFLEELTIFVSRDGRLAASPDGSGSLVSSAKVLSVDPSYRLLTLQYPDGSRETFKVGREANLRQVESGDDVAIRVLEVAALAARMRW